MKKGCGTAVSYFIRWLIILALMAGQTAAAFAEQGSLTPGPLEYADGNVVLNKYAERTGPKEWKVTVTADLKAIEVQPPKLEVVFVLDGSGTMMWCTDETNHNAREIHANYICGEHIHTVDCFTKICTQAENPDHYYQSGAYWIHNQTAGATPCRNINSAWRSPNCGSTHVHTNACCSCGTDACVRHDTVAYQGKPCTVNGVNMQTRFDCAIQVISKLSSSIPDAAKSYVVFSNKGQAKDYSLDALRQISPSGYTYIMEGVDLGIGLFKEEEATKIMVLVTDGVASDNKYTSDAFKGFTADGGMVFTVGFNHVDQKLSGMTANGGVYYHASNPDELTDAFDDIGAKITSMVVDPMGPKVDFDLSDTAVSSGSLVSQGDTIYWKPGENQKLEGRVVEYTYKVTLNENADISVGTHTGIKLNNPTSFRYSVESNGVSTEYEFPFPIPEASYSVSTLQTKWQLLETGEPLMPATEVELVMSDYVNPDFETDYKTITQQIPIDGSEEYYRYVDTIVTANGVEIAGVDAVDAALPKEYLVVHRYERFNPADLGGVLTLSKTVGGNMGSQNQPFDFVVSLPEMPGETVRVSTDGGMTYGALTLDAQGQATFTLRHGDVLMLEQVRGSYTVTEVDPGGYTASYAIDQGEAVNGTSANGTVDAAGCSVTFVNTLQVSPPTGIHTSSASALMGVCLAGILMWITSIGKGGARIDA